MPKYREDDYFEGFTPIQEGKYRFQIRSLPEVKKSYIQRGSNVGRQILMFKFELAIHTLSGELVRDNILVNLPNWEVGNIWRAVGLKKDADGYWDIGESVVSETFEGELIHQQFKGKKDGKTKTGYKIINVVIPKEYLEDVEKKDNFTEKVNPKGQESDDVPPPTEEDAPPDDDEDDIPF